MTPARGPERALEGAVGALARTLAERLTRRSTLARLGRYGVALSLGAAGTTLLDDQAWAAASTCCGGGCQHTCCGGCNYSVWCNYGGYCPPGTCECGGWTLCERCTTSGGQAGVYWYGDCCGGCGNGCSCSGCSPSCCNYHDWNNGSCAACDCRTGDSAWHINCRRKYCNTNTAGC